MGEAPTPKQMVLHGLAGCTGMDVAAILAKRKVGYDRFTIEVEAEQTAHHPRVFREIHLTYRFVANPEDRTHIERAVELSRNNFCGVSAMLEKTANIISTVEITPRPS
jgi:putative redox protein